MHCKRPSGFSMAFSKCLFIRPHARIIDSHRIEQWEWMRLQWVLTRSHFSFSQSPHHSGSHSLFLYVRCKINQYKANKRIVYLIYLSGASIHCQVHSWSVCALCHLNHYTVTVIVITVTFFSLIFWIFCCFNCSQVYFYFIFSTSLYRVFFRIVKIHVV